MAKFKLKLQTLPAFPLKVKFNLINGDEAEIVFKCRHLKPNDLKELYNAEGGTKDYEFIMALCESWDLDEEFNQENVKELVELFPSAAVNLTQSYSNAMIGQRVKN